VDDLIAKGIADRNAWDWRRVVWRVYGGMGVHRRRVQSGSLRPACPTDFEYGTEKESAVTMVLGTPYEKPKDS